MINSLYRAGSVPYIRAVLIVRVRPSVISGASILRTSFRMLSGPVTFPFSRHLRTSRTSFCVTSGLMLIICVCPVAPTSSCRSTYKGVRKNFSARIYKRSLLLSVALSLPYCLSTGIYGSVCGLPALSLLHFNSLQSTLLCGY
jgi:hypothetical protein